MTTFLDPLDSAFVLLEIPGSSMNIGAIVELEMGDIADPKERFEVIRANIVDRLHEIPVLNKRIVRAPFDLTWPILVVDKKMDINRHVIRVAVPAPGTPDQFDALVSDFLSRPLHPKRPLWQILVIEGLQDGRSAVAIKVHHALADGVSGAETFASLFDISPDVRPPAPKVETPDEKSLGSFGLLRKSLAKLRHEPRLAYQISLSWFTRTWHILKSVTKALIARGKKKPLTESPSLFEAKKTSLNGASGSEKEYHRLQLSLPDVKRAAKSRGATVTDFVTCVTSGALRRLIEDRGEVLKKDLVAFVPINVRGSGDAAALGNQISGMLVRMHATETDPEERLRLISADSKKNVAVQREENAKILQEVPRVLGPLTLSVGGKLISRLGLFNRIPPIANLMLSSVPGPPLPLWLSGHRVASAAPVGPLLGPVSLNVTVLGFEGYLEFGLLGCGERMHDLSTLRDFIREESENFFAATTSE
jgi:diacylglycerol O-acyltransferase / wax synthase